VAPIEPRARDGLVLGRVPRKDKPKLAAADVRLPVACGPDSAASWSGPPAGAVESAVASAHEQREDREHDQHRAHDAADVRGRLELRRQLAARRTTVALG
jgi:hypothetical protein